ncbi:toxin co-regulated pilus biosynthesis Q family protein [Stenotrophomonas maltophilia]|uniref:toxin co-regulated pilus biosynthesis Q family protein n=1 Tax=Stenotrophomonas maltophilia TaxID=40324 RepID=UPI0021C7293E|nr:toxin co-regulated pilus biosynthesis Q family protein [Stenotrophomonas maltophilia]MCU1142259.1 TcpQ domain-containing protein [Stenotrophomonas maltophilia]
MGELARTVAQLRHEGKSRTLAPPSPNSFPRMRYFGGIASASAALMLAAAPGAHAGPAVVISRDMLALVTEQTNSCPPDRVIFVTRDSRVVATCDGPPEPEPRILAEALDVTGDAPSVLPSPQQTGAPDQTPVFVAAPVPKWSVEQGESIREAIAAWLPSDWTLAWDTDSTPLANARFEYQGDSMAAIADLFDRRSLWPEMPLTACSFPKERILQVRAGGECGAP